MTEKEGEPILRPEIPPADRRRLKHDLRSAATILKYLAHNVEEGIASMEDVVGELKKSVTFLEGLEKRLFGTAVGETPAAGGKRDTPTSKD